MFFKIICLNIIQKEISQTTTTKTTTKTSTTTCTTVTAITIVIMPLIHLLLPNTYKERQKIRVVYYLRVIRWF